MIRIVTQNTAEDYVKFRKFNVVKKDPIGFIVAPAVIVLLGVVMLFVNPAFGIVLLAVGILYPPLIAISSMVSTKKFIKNAKTYLSTATRAEFTEEGVRLVAVSPDSKPVEAAAEYRELHSVYETKDTFYLYLTKGRCVILPKRDVDLGTPEELTELLKKKLLSQKKYVYRK